MNALAKVRLIPTIPILALWVAIALRRRPLPDVVTDLTEPGRSPGRATLPPRGLARAVDKVLDPGPLRTRCVIKALVLFRLLRRDDVPCELVIGMPESPLDKDAHAWVEVGGVDVGPSPGRMGLHELVRYA